MSLRIRFQYQTGSKLGYSIERLSDGSFYDFSTSTFVATPTTLISSLPEDSGSFLGRYKLTMNPTPVAQFTDGDYAITIHDEANSNNVVAELGATMHAGDDATVIPQPGSAVVDPWTVSLPGSYTSGSAGSIVGTYLDAHVSSRSTYAGGPVASVTAPVTLAATQVFNNTGQTTAYPTAGGSFPSASAIATAVWTDLLTSSDFTTASSAGAAFKASLGTSGAILASNGLDAIQVETGINARQALSPILAACAGVVAGAGTGVVVIKGGNSSTTRITANTDNAGNRSSVTLTLPT